MRLSSRMFLTIVALLLVVSASSTSTAQAQDWQKYFWDEQSKSMPPCSGGIDGLRAEGDYGYKTSVSCRPGNIADVTTATATIWISEEEPHNKVTCANQKIVTQLGCRHDYCDDYELYCAQLSSKYRLSDCAWRGWLSDEADDPNDDFGFAAELMVLQTQALASNAFGGDADLWDVLNKTNSFYFPERVLVGLWCRGGACDDRALKTCRITEDKGIDYAKLPIEQEGTWERFCTEEAECEITVGQQYSVTENLANSWSKELETSLTSELAVSSTVGAEVDGGVATASSSLTVEARISAGLRSAKSRAQTKEKGIVTGVESQVACKIKAPPGKAVFYWGITMKIGDEYVKMKSCDFACSDSWVRPDWERGANLGSCKSPAPAKDPT